MRIRLAAAAAAIGLALAAPPMGASIGGFGAALAAGEDAAGVSKLLPKGIEADAAFFVIEEFLDGGNTLDRLEKFYGEYVFYFDRGVRSRAQVLEDKRLYVTRWPDRTLTPDLSTLQTKSVKGGDGRIDVEVNLEIDFEVSSPIRSASGRSTVSLLLAKRSGQFIILSEGGRVISRR
ncbi:MAG: hypothetical protein AAGM38_17690 [Pseudomonadota bacterium]